MPSNKLSYQEVFSRFYSKIQAYDFLDLSEIQLNEFLCNWLKSTLSKPHVRKLFSKDGYSRDDIIQEISFEMSYKIDDDTDVEFVTEVLALGMIVEWLSPKINSIQNIAQVFASSDEKFYSQSNHLSELRNIRDDAVKQQRNLISDRGYTWNTYLDNES